MALVVTSLYQSLPLVGYMYDVTGLVLGANAIVLPVPPATGSFPVAGDWTPTVIYCFPYQSGAVGALVTPDYTTITNTAGAITFTLYAGGATNVLLLVA